jgi:hypothetical protein
MDCPILYPPRPKGKLLPGRLAEYEKTGKWVAQRKFNGTRTLIYVSENKEVSVLTRHGGGHSKFATTEGFISQVLSLDLEAGKSYWFDGELMHSRTKDVNYKNKVVLFDILQAGHYLFNSPDQMKRLEMLAAICRHPVEYEPAHQLALKVTDDIWLAEVFENRFVERFQEAMPIEEIEGLVLRKRDSVIDHLGGVEYEVTWQQRVRKPGKSYDF